MLTRSLFAVTLLAIGTSFRQNTEHVQYYTVEGSTINELVDAMLFRGPTGTNGTHYYATSMWNLKWQNTTKRVPEGCMLDAVTVEFEATFVYPKWDKAMTAPAPLGPKWRSFVTALKRYHNGRREFGIDAANAIRTLPGKLPSQPTCQAVNKLLSDSANAIMARARTKVVEYDRNTEGGRTQGAYLSN